jgi:malonyl CoA-acyl carrier protein transacylase/acyl-CoA thioesterase FadM
MDNSELFLFSANNKEQLIVEAKELQNNLNQDLRDLSCTSNKRINFSEDIKAALVAKDKIDLNNLLNKLINAIETQNLGSEKIDDSQIYFSNSKTKHKLCFLFPPQGSQQINSAQILIEKFSWAKEISKKIDEELLNNIFLSQEKILNDDSIKNLAKSENAQISITLSSLLWLEFLKKLGIEPDAVLGHGIGEMVALYEIGALTIDELISGTILCGQAMGNTKTIGSMVELECDFNRAKDLIKNIKNVEISNINSPNQITISGDKEGILAIIKSSNENFIANKELIVGNAFHSKLMSGAANYFSENFRIAKKFKIKEKPIFFSSIYGKKLEDEILIKDYLSKNMTSPVKFMDAVKTFSKDIDLTIEIGPGEVLSGLVKKNNKNISCFSVEKKAGSLFDFNITLANLFVRNFIINTKELHEEQKIEKIELSEVLAKKEQEKIEPIAKKNAEDLEKDFIWGLKEFAKNNSLELIKITTPLEQNFNTEIISYRTDYQWIGILNGYSRQFLELAEIVEKNTAGTIIMSVLKTISKNHNAEKLQIRLINNNNNYFLFKASGEEIQILIIATKLPNKVKDIIASKIVKKQEISANLMKNDELKEKSCIYKSSLDISIQNSNLVGNLHLSNYHQWQSEAFDNFVYRKNPEFFLNDAHKFLFKETKIEQFRNISPFDKIELLLYIRNVDNNSFNLVSEFYCISNKKEMLASGSSKVIFLTKNSEKSISNDLQIYLTPEVNEN